MAQWIAILRAIEFILGVSCSVKPKWVQIRNDIRQDLRKNYAQPFLEGLHGVPCPSKKPPQTKMSSWFGTAVLLALVLTVPVLYLRFPALRRVSPNVQDIREGRR